MPDPLLTKLSSISLLLCVSTGSDVRLISCFPFSIAASFAADTSDAANPLPTVLPALIADFPISLAAALD